MNFPDVVTAVVPAFVLLILLEMTLVRLRAKGDYETRDAAASLAMGLGNQIAPLLGGGALLIGALTALYEFRIATIPNAWWAVALCFVLDDFRYYWWHRWSHECRWLWASHVVHHSSQHYNLSTALRQPWTGLVIPGVLSKGPLVLLGFHPAMIVFVGGLNLIYQFWIHTEQIKRLGPLEWVMNTPSHHRVHHATNPRYLDSNYAGVFIIWDRMFGSFAAEQDDEAPRYGIVKNLGAFNPIVISFHEWIAMFHDVRKAKSFHDGFYFLFGPPGWSPDGARMTSAQIKERWRRMTKRTEAAGVSEPSPRPNDAAIA